MVKTAKKTKREDGPSKEMLPTLRPSRGEEVEDIILRRGSVSWGRGQGGGTMIPPKVEYLALLHLRPSTNPNFGSLDPPRWIQGPCSKEGSPATAIFSSQE